MTPPDAQPPEVDAPPLTLTDFLLARLAEDEAVARRVLAVGSCEPAYRPARVLAEVEAKRRIVELHNQWDDASGEQYPPAYWDAPVDEILYALASVYSDHPDWREEWRP